MEGIYNPNQNLLVGLNSYFRRKAILSFVDKDIKSILDIGCGIGHTLNKIKTQSSLTGIDINKEALEIAERDVDPKANYGHFLEFIKVDAQNFNLNKKFEIIICSELLEHVEQPSKVIDCILKHSNNETRIIITIPNEEANDKLWSIIKFFRLEKKFKGMIKRENHISQFNLNKFLSLINGNLRILAIKKTPPLLHNCYIFCCERNERNKKV